MTLIEKADKWAEADRLLRELLVCFAELADYNLIQKSAEIGKIVASCKKEALQEAQNEQEMINRNVGIGI